MFAIEKVSVYVYANWLKGSVVVRSQKGAQLANEFTDLQDFVERLVMIGQGNVWMHAARYALIDSQIY